MQKPHVGSLFSVYKIFGRHVSVSHPLCLLYKMPNPRKSSQPWVPTKKAQEPQKTTQRMATQPRCWSALKSKQKTVNDGSDSDRSQSSSCGDACGCTSGSPKYCACGQKQNQCCHHSTSFDEVEVSGRDNDTEEVIEERQHEDEMGAACTDNKLLVESNTLTT